MTGQEYYYLSNGDYVVYKGKQCQVTEVEGNTSKNKDIIPGQLFQVVWSHQDVNKEGVFVKDVEGAVFQFSTKRMLQDFEKYDEKKLGLSDDWQMKLEEAHKPQLKANEMIITTDYLETLLNITADMTDEFYKLGFSRVEYLDIFKKWATEFEKMYGEHDWEDGEISYLEALSNFEYDKMFDIKAKSFVWDEQAAINLQYIQNVNGCPEEEFVSSPQSDINRRLAMEFTMYEKDNHIDYDDPNQGRDWESTISEWLSKHKR